MKNMKKHAVVRALMGALAVLTLFMTTVTALASAQQAQTVRVGVLKGPSALGATYMMKEMPERYAFTVAGAPDEVVAALAAGQLDIAALPLNAAAALYNKTEGAVQLMVLSTESGLYIVENGDTVRTVDDLAGKTLNATGQGATPEYTLQYILNQKGIADKVQVAFNTEHAELATLVAGGQVNLAMLPEPFVTTVMMKNPSLRIAVDVTAAFNEAAKDNGARMAMTGWMVRKQFAAEQPDAVARFLADYTTSAEMTRTDTDQVAAMAAELTLLPSAEVAVQAIPRCGIANITGADVRARTEPLLAIWFAANPKSVGGKLPGEDFYYVAP